LLVHPCSSALSAMFRTLQQRCFFHRPASMVDSDWRHAGLLRDLRSKSMSILGWLTQPSPPICPGTGLPGLPASLKSWMVDLEWLEHQPLRSKVSGFSL
jgi:hypothetical protein